MLNRVQGIIIFCLLLFASCSTNNIERDLGEKRSVIKDQTLFLVIDTTSNSEVRSALAFLYAYMPLGDISDYDGALFEEGVKIALETKESTTWGKRIPDDIFRHFVLPLRVNNETLDSARGVIYRELLPRVKDLTLDEAILEVNHWCHEYVTYSPSDERTSSPLATMRNGEGRCGEEAVFTVTALRAVGIPARLVYTPRWAHTDDNHAWVEAWADGVWYYIGACEPEPRLNEAWFTTSATRALLMHSRVFGSYSGPEDIISKSGTFTEINVTPNYTKVSNIEIRVEDLDGNTVKDALVEFCIYNYAEFWPALRLRSNSNGLVMCSMGMGDILVRASKDSSFGISLISPRQSVHSSTIVLDKYMGDEFIVEKDVTPPAQALTSQSVSNEEIAANRERLEREDSIRVDRVMRSDGNRGELEKFRLLFSDKNRDIGETILSSISTKDMKDTPSKVLEDHLFNIDAKERDPYIISPRIGRELLTPWRSFLQNIEEAHLLAGDIDEIIKLVKSVKIETKYNPQSIAISPAGVYRMRVADTYSRDLFFVALCRSFGIAARLNPLTLQPQYRVGEAWRYPGLAVDGQKELSDASGLLRVLYDNEASVEDPKFETHFTISVADDGTFKPLSFRDREGFEGTYSWQSVFGSSSGVSLKKGYYLLTSGTRMASGKTLTRMHFFNIKENDTTLVPLVLREDPNDIKVLANINVTNDIVDITGRGYFVIAFLKYAHEPSNHVLDDIIKYKDDFKQWGRKLLFYYPDARSLDLSNRDDIFKTLPDNFIFTHDLDSQLISMVAEGLGSEQNIHYPLVVIADTFGRVVYISQGYTIGTGEMLLKTIKKL